MENKKINNGKVSKMKLAGKMAKKLGANSLKLAVAPIVGNLPDEYKHAFYVEDDISSPKSNVASYLSSMINFVSAPVVSGYLTGNIVANYTNDSEVVVLTAIVGGSLGFAAVLFNEMPRIMADGYSGNYFSKGSLIGYALAGVYDSIVNSYKESVEEIVQEKLREEKDKMSNDGCLGAFVAVLALATISFVAVLGYNAGNEKYKERVRDSGRVMDINNDGILDLYVGDADKRGDIYVNNGHGFDSLEGYLKAQEPNMEARVNEYHLKAEVMTKDLDKH